jgi:hypothetical protein
MFWKTEEGKYGPRERMRREGEKEQEGANGDE